MTATATRPSPQPPTSSPFSNSCKATMLTLITPHHTQPTTFLPFFMRTRDVLTWSSTFPFNVQHTHLTSTTPETASPTSFTPRRPHASATGQLATATTYRTADTHHNPDCATSPQRHTILTLLRDIDAPHSTIFEALSHYESPRPVALPRVLASALLVHSLGTLECALWASAIEHLSLSLPAGADPALHATKYGA